MKTEDMAYYCMKCRKLKKIKAIRSKNKLALQAAAKASKRESLSQPSCCTDLNVSNMQDSVSKPPKKKVDLEKDADKTDIKLKTNLTGSGANKAEK